jgi:DNA-binding MarR family transcriptional regulator
MNRKSHYGYLLCFLYERPREKRTASEAARYTGASRQTLYNHVDAFEKEGLLWREGPVFSLTEKGRKYAAPLAKRLHNVRVFLETDLGCEIAEATGFAMRMLLDLPLPAAFAQRMADRGAVYNAGAVAARAGNPDISLPDGRYNIPFAVCCPGGRVESAVSMGFKSVELSATAEGYALELQTRPFFCQSGPDSFARGVLTRFWYKRGDDWTEVKKTAKRWFIPGDVIEVSKEAGELIGRLRFKVWAAKSCGMPEIEGDIVLIFRRDAAAVF